jgi:hypothetical protein
MLFGKPKCPVDDEQRIRIEESLDRLTEKHGAARCLPAWGLAPCGRGA